MKSKSDLKRVWTDIDDAGEVIRQGSYKIKYDYARKVPHKKLVQTPEFSVSSYYKIFFKVVHMIAYESNILKVKGRYAKVSDLCKRAGVCESTMKKFLSECRKRKIIMRDKKERAYVLNPEYVFKGRSVFDWVYAMFL